MEKVRKNVNLKHHSKKYSRSIFFVGGALTLAFIVLVIGVYVYDRTSVLNTEKKAEIFHHELVKEVAGDSGYNETRNPICLRNVNKFEYVFKETCELTLSTKIKNNISIMDNLKKYLQRNKYQIKSVFDTTANTTTTDTDTEANTLLYAANIDISSSSSCIVSIYRVASTTIEYELETRCLTKVFFSPYEVKTI